MTVPVFLAVGVALLALGLFVVRDREGAWVTPGMFLVLVYAINFFFDPITRYLELRPIPIPFNADAWPQLTIYNTLCFGAFLCGYMLVPWSRYRANRSTSETRLQPMFSRLSFSIAASFCLLCIIAQYIGFAYYGRFEYDPIVFNYYRPLGFEFIVSLVPILNIFIPAIFVSAYLEESTRKGMRKTAFWILLMLGVALTLATFARRVSFEIVIVIAMIYHFRYKKLRMSQIFAGVVFVVIANAVALLRRLHVGILNIDLGMVGGLIGSEGATLVDLFFYTVTIFEGQSVHSYVIDIVDKHTGPFYGRTYLDAIFSRTIPFYSIFESELQTPSEWYHEVRGYPFYGVRMTFSLIAETYLNFGRQGWFIFGFIGFFTSWLSFQIRTTRSPVMLVWAAFSLISFMAALRDDLIPLFMRVTWYIVPLIVARGLLQFSGLPRIPGLSGRRGRE